MDEVEVRQLLESLKNADDSGEFKIAWENASQYFLISGGSDNDKALLSSILFNANTGVFGILQDSFLKYGKTAYKDRGLVLKFLADKVIPDPEYEALKHAELILQCCIKLFRVEEQGSAKLAAMEPVQALLQVEGVSQLCSSCQNEWRDLVNTLKHALQRNKKLTLPQRGQMLHVLGDVLRLFPKEFQAGQDFNAEWLMQECFQLLSSSSTGSGASTNAGALAGLMAALPFCANQRLNVSAQVQLAYREMRQMINKSVVQNASRYLPVRTALRMLSEHGWLFGELLLKDCLPLLDDLSALRCDHQNKYLRNEADVAFTAFLHQVALLLLEVADGPQSGWGRDVLSKMLGASKALLDKKEAKSREIMVAVRTFGHLATPAFKYFGEQGVKSLMRNLTPLLGRSNLPLLEKISDLEGAAVEVETSLLSTLACLLECLPSLQDASMQTCMQVAERVVGAYLQLWPKQQPAVLKALMQLLYSVHAKPSGLSALSQQLAVLLLTHTLKELDMGSLLAGPLAVDPDAAEDKEAWEVYMSMWRALLKADANHLPSDFVAGMQENKDQWELVMTSMYDELMRSCIDALNNMDIKYSSIAGTEGTAAATTTTGDNEGAGAEADASDLKNIQASNLADMRVFLRLSVFLSTCLQECGPERFKNWEALLTVQLVTQSRNYPLLSGFYRMIKVTMQLCSARGVFKQGRAAGATPDSQAALVTSVYKEFLADVLTACRYYKVAPPSYAAGVPCPWSMPKEAPYTS